MTAVGGERGVVVDASVVVDALVVEDGAAARESLRGVALHAPYHFDVEVLSAVGRLARGGAIAAQRAEVAVGDLERIPVERHPATPLLTRAWSMRHQLRLTDALYVALAEDLSAPLITTDRRLARALAGSHPGLRVIVPGPE